MDSPNPVLAPIGLPQNSSFSGTPHCVGSSPLLARRSPASPLDDAPQVPLPAALACVAESCTEPRAASGGPSSPAVVALAPNIAQPCAASVSSPSSRHDGASLTSPGSTLPRAVGASASSPGSVLPRAASVVPAPPRVIQHVYTRRALQVPPGFSPLPKHSPPAALPKGAAPRRSSSMPTPCAPALRVAFGCRLDQCFMSPLSHRFPRPTAAP